MGGHLFGNGRGSATATRSRGPGMIYHGALRHEGDGGTVAVRVALFITCFNDTLFPETGRATVEVLERLGHEGEFPFAQTCCGQMHFNTGYQREAIPLVRRFVEVFSPYEAVVAPSPPRVTYHPPCHSLRMLGVGDAPLELLKAVRGIDLVELPEARECCG